MKCASIRVGSKFARSCQKCGNRSQMLVNYEINRAQCLVCGNVVIEGHNAKPKKYEKIVCGEELLRRRYVSCRKRSDNRFECCSYEEFKKWWNGSCDVCVYCNGLLGDIHKKGKIISIDRIVNSIGYIPDNMVKACYMCNSIKNEYFTYAQMIKIASHFREL